MPSLLGNFEIRGNLGKQVQG